MRLEVKDAPTEESIQTKQTWIKWELKTPLNFTDFAKTSKMTKMPFHHSNTREKER